MSTWQTFLWGVFGSVALEFLHTYRDYRSSSVLPRRYRSLIFWTVRAVMSAISGLVSVGYSAAGSVLTPITAVTIGAAVPLIITELARIADRPGVPNEGLNAGARSSSPGDKRPARTRPSDSKLRSRPRRPRSK